MIDLKRKHTNQLKKRTENSSAILIIAHSNLCHSERFAFGMRFSLSILFYFFYHTKQPNNNRKTTQERERRKKTPLHLHTINTVLISAFNLYSASSVFNIKNIQI